jgi:uncharacterized SAM-binding protein YcdF (DUF218 family)
LTTSTEIAEKRIAAAHENSWENRIAAMNQLIEAALERRGASAQRWEVTLRRVYRETRTHAVKLLLGVAAAYLIVFHTGFVWWAAAPLRVMEPLAPADAIVVFAGGVGESGKAGGGTDERVQHAVEIFDRGYARHLVFSSGYTYSFREAEVMRSLAVQHGVPPEAIELEQRSTDTHENVIFSGEILRARGWTSAVLVSSPYHMRRALLVWKKADPDIKVIPAPPARSQFYDHARGASFDQVRAIVHEYLAIAGYRLRGWI